MTIYSGFPTRKLQQKYNSLLTQLIKILSQIIITYVQRSKIQPFEKQFTKLYTNIEKMDNLKHLEPKFSVVLRSIGEHVMGFEERSDTVPESIVDVQRKEKKEMRREFVSSGVGNYQQGKKRPMTGNNYVQQHRGQSIQLQRKTISLINDKQRNHVIPYRYQKLQKPKIRNKSFSLKNSSNNFFPITSSTTPHPNTQGYLFQKKYSPQIQLQTDITMQQLMQKNRLVERKMTLFRKKKHVQPSTTKISRIPELEEEQQREEFGIV